MNIKIKFILFNTFLILLITAGLGFLSILTVKNLLYKETENRGIELARELAQESHAQTALKDESSILKTIQELRKDDQILSAIVCDALGRIVAHNNIREVGQAVPVQSDLRIRFEENEDRVHSVVVSVPIQAGETVEEDFLFEKSGPDAVEKDSAKNKFLGFAQIQLNLEKPRSIIKEIALLIGALMAGAIFIAMGLVFYVLNMFLAPLQSLKQGVDLLGAGDLNHRVKIVSNDEIAGLARSFNHMVEKLQGSLAELKDSKDATDELNRNLEARVKERTQEIEQAQYRLVQSEKMTAVGQLAAGVAHEINNPLGIILGFSQGLVQRLKPNDPLELPLKSIEREAVRCKNLVQDLLTFSRTDQQNRVPVDLNKAIEGALSLIGASSKMSSVEIKKELSPDVLHVLGNQNQIQQVIINLSNNAIDAMPNGGTLGISTLVQNDTPQSWICLKISDTGAGIPKDIQSKIFEPFFTTKPVGKGTGLGLSLVFDIVKKHSGLIELESRPGFTEFCVKFPVRTG